MIRPAEMSDDQFEDQAIGHLLGELDVRVEITFQEELARRGTPGHAMLRELREALGELALAVAPAEPPPSLRARVLWSIGAPVAAPDAPPAASRTFWIWAAAALMAAVAVGLGVWADRLSDERDELRAHMALVSDAGTTVRELRGTRASPDASARVFFAARSGRGVLLAEGLPAPGSGRVYALWTMDAEGAQPTGFFLPDEEGRVRLELVDLELAPGTVLTVTEEPAPGGERPTGRTLLTSS
ncbi:MAG TPA: anti-sigma factor [Gemmatimonadota bacterium]|nr:anti-sigma factor [Gemmatimonadota bacterium]